jgi:hypothetical protein
LILIQLYTSYKETDEHVLSQLVKYYVAYDDTRHLTNCSVLNTNSSQVSCFLSTEINNRAYMISNFLGVIKHSLILVRIFFFIYANTIFNNIKIILKPDP